jgi:hypothetical protein
MTKHIEEYYPPGPVVKGAAYSNKYFNTTFTKGSKPKFVWITGMKDMPSKIEMSLYKEGVGRFLKEYKLESIAYDEKIPPQAIINWDKMILVSFKKKLENIFEAVGWNWEEEDKTQSSLAAFQT